MIFLLTLQPLYHFSILQLFSLQLRDPVLRQQVAVQLLYFIHYVRSKAPLPPSLVAEGLQVSEVSQDLLHIHDRASAVLEVETTPMVCC